MPTSIGDVGLIIDLYGKWISNPSLLKSQTKTIFAVIKVLEMGYQAESGKPKWKWIRDQVKYDTAEIMHDKHTSLYRRRQRSIKYLRIAFVRYKEYVQV